MAKKEKRKNKREKLAINQTHYVYYPFYYSQQHYEEINLILFMGQLWLKMSGDLSNARR